MKKFTLWDKIKHFGAFIWLLILTIWETLRNKWVWLAIGVIVYTYLVSWFNSNYKIDCKFKFGIYQRTTPIKNASVVPQVKAQEKKPVVVALTEEQIVKGQKYGDILWKIYQLETQRGKTDYCRTFGTFGGFGVKNNKNEIHCYMTFKEAAERASYWFGTHYPSKTLVDALCTWNKGTKERPVGGYMNCWYYQQYLSL